MLGEPPLPLGWEKRQAEDGRFYYMDHNDHTTTWEDPLSSKPKVYAKLRDINEPLPSGWERRETPHGSTYFVNHGTKTTTWLDPRIAGVKSALESGPMRDPTSVFENLGPLPSGWELRFTPAERMYFVNHNNKTTSWMDPRKAQDTVAKGSSSVRNLDSEEEKAVAGTGSAVTICNAAIASSETGVPSDNQSNHDTELGVPPFAVQDTSTTDSGHNSLPGYTQRPSTQADAGTADRYEKSL
jgi:WW domain